MNLRKAFLWAVLGSLVIAAIVGIVALLFDLRSERWILSTLSTGLFSLLALGAAYAAERRVWTRAMQVNVALCVFGLTLFIFMIWFGRDLYNPLEDVLEKTMGLSVTWAAALTAAGMLAITRFAPGALSVIRIVALVMIVALATMISVTILADPHESEWYRFMGATSIATALGIVGVPILHKVHGIKTPADVVTTPTELAITCPRCLLAQTITAGDSRCAHCKLKFHLEIEDPRCPECNYLLYRLTSPRCPECGHQLAPDDVESSAPPPSSVGATT